MKTDPVIWLHQTCADILEEVRTLFTDNVKLTLIVRNIDAPSRDVIVTDDDEAEIRRRLEGWLDLS